MTEVNELLEEAERCAFTRRDLLILRLEQGLFWSKAEGRVKADLPLISRTTGNNSGHFSEPQFLFPSIKWKSYHYGTGPRITNATLKGQNKVGEPHCPAVGPDTKQQWPWHVASMKERTIDPRNSTESLETPPQIWSVHLWQRGNGGIMSKDCLQQMVLELLDIHNQICKSEHRPEEGEGWTGGAQRLFRAVGTLRKIAQWWYTVVYTQYNSKSELCCDNWGRRWCKVGSPIVNRCTLGGRWSWWGKLCMTGAGASGESLSSLNLVVNLKLF